MTHSEIKKLVLLAGLFFISRIMFWSVGVSFDSHPLVGAWQYLDQELLRNDLLRSVYYLHAQPPLFNLLLGAVVKISTGCETTLFALIYLILGLLLASSMFLVMNRLGVNENLSFLLTALFMISPAAILFENGLFYTYPVACLLCLATVFVHEVGQKVTYRDTLILFVLLAMVVLIRSIFNIVWLTVICLVVLILKRDSFKIIAVGFLIPFSIVVLWHAKNVHLFQMFSTSSWLGMSLAYNTTARLPSTTVEPLVRANVLSELALIEPFSPVASYLPYLPSIEKMGIPTLDDEFRSTNAINYNHIGYLFASRLYLQDALKVMRQFPLTYLVAVIGAFKVSMMPASEYHNLRGNRKHIQLFEAIYNPVFYGQLPSARGEILGVVSQEDLGRAILNRLRQVGFVIVFMYLVAVLYGLSFTIRLTRQKPLDLPRLLTILFVWFNIVYVSLATNLVSNTGENMRFRFMIDPFIVITFGLFLGNQVPDLARRFGKKLARTS